jgi:hypothetical protein
MYTASHSKCKICNKVRNLSELIESSKGIGLVCEDTASCKKEQSKNTESKS